jgi:outer membrane protein assembly factor BamE (lipoprotein component of BamABCDE complex)/phage gp37-like protein
LKNLFALLLLSLLPNVSLAQQQSKVEENLQEAMLARYRITVVGTKLFSARDSEDSIRKIGGTVIVVKPGLFGSLDRREITSNAIRDDKRTLLSGQDEVSLLPGERFYVNSVRVGSDFVTLGLLSADPRNVGGRVDRAWAAVNFFFKPAVVQNGDLKTINAAMDQWLLPADSIPNGPVAPVATVSVSPKLPPSFELKPGMSKEEVIAGLGTPLQVITFSNHNWLSYPALVVVLEDGKLTEVDRTQDANGELKFDSDPPASEIYVDGELAGTTPATLQVPVGAHKVELKMHGKSVWQENVRVFPGATVNLKPTLNAAGK